MRTLCSKHLLLAMVVSLTFILTQCSDQENPAISKPKLTTQRPHPGGVYRTPLLNSPITLDPASVEDIYGINVVDQIFDGLVQFSPDLLIIPALAENWQIEEGGRVYRFFLRPNTQFHNGELVSSQDVVFSLSRLIRTQPAPTILPHLLKIVGAREYSNRQSDQLDGLQVLDDHQLLIRLEEPHAPFLAALGMHQAKIVPEREVLRKGNTFGLRPVGSGAFRFVSRDDHQILLQRFPDFYGGTAYLDEIRYVIYPGGRMEEILADFQNQKLEDMPVYGKIRQTLLAQTDLQWIHRPSLSLLFYGMNCDHPLLRNVDLRKALSLAIDRQKLVRSVYDGQLEPARSILPPGMPGYNPENQRVVDDIARAQSYLDRSLREKIAIAATLEIVSAIQSPLAIAELEFVRESWAQLGISLQPRFVPDWTKFEEYVKSDALQIYRYAWFVDIPDPDNIFQVLFGSDSNLNFMRYNNKEIDRMLHLARTLAQPMERAEMYQRIEEIILDSTPLIPLVHLSIDHAYQANVHGMHLNALGGHAVSFHRVWLDPA
jgi:oligopeptide transport system substrate-binding protein